MEGEVEGLLVSRELDESSGMQGITTTGGKHGMICGVNVFGVLFAARFISLFFSLRIEIPRMRLFRHLDSRLALHRTHSLYT